MATPKFKNRSALVKAQPAAPRKRFAFKRPLALAIEQLLITKMVGVMHVTDAPPREPDGGYAIIALRLNYERDMSMVKLAMAAAPITDGGAMMQRMAWLAGRQSGKTEMGITGARALVGDDDELSPSDDATV